MFGKKMMEIEDDSEGMGPGKDLDIIMELMDELKNKMEYGKDDFEERLGRKKPEMPAAVEVTKIEGELPEVAMEMSEDPMDIEDEDMMEMDPDKKLKQRLMKLRG